MGPCAKLQVEFVLFGREGETVRGRNDCESPQSVCPRAAGEDYTKCKAVCQQPGHAETMAIAAARAVGMDLTDARGNLYGQDDICDHCTSALITAGVRFVTIYGKGSTAPT